MGTQCVFGRTALHRQFVLIIGRPFGGMPWDDVAHHENSCGKHASVAYTFTYHDIIIISQNSYIHYRISSARYDFCTRFFDRSWY